MGSLLITGARGYVGRALASSLQDAGNDVMVTSRVLDPALKRKFPRAEAMDLEDPHADWTALLEGIDTVVHLAARVHVRSRSHADLDAHENCNHVGTMRLARACLDAGVRRFVFSSSVLVHGPHSEKALSEEDECHPFDAYTESKLRAERDLTSLAEASDLEVTTLRLPMIYGPMAKGNFLRLAEAVRKRIPLPLAGVRNLRSFLGIRNAVSALVHAADASSKPGLYLISDQEPISTTEFIERIAAAMGEPSRLFRCPTVLLKTSAAMLGRSRDYDRVCRSLWVDDRKTIELLGWRAPYRMSDELAHVFS